VSYTSITLLALVAAVAACDRPNPLYVRGGGDRDATPGSDAFPGPADTSGTPPIDGGTPDTQPGALDARPTLDLAPAPGLDAAGSPAPDAAPSPPPVWKGDVTHNLVLYLPLDDGSGKSVLRDASGMQGVAALKSVDPVAGWTSGRFGQALALKGASWSGYINVTGTPLQQVAAEKFSVALWIWRTDATSGSLMSRRWSGTSGVLFNLALENGSLAMQLNSASGYNAHVVGNGAVPQGRWVHVAVTYDLQFVRLYVDGMPVGAGPYQMAIPVDTTAIVIGGLEQSSGTVATKFTGMIDDLTMYSRALAALDVSDLATGARPPLK
jgi:hypothetical protein